MAVSWSKASINFDPLAPLKDPLESVLTILESTEAVLEALLDIIKVALIDLGNPIKAIISLLLAAIRTIINQIKSSGFSILLIHPDFSRQDFSGVIQSVSGSYPSFESKVINKFHDTSDIFRPQYGPGSSVGVVALYIGSETPGDLLLQLFSLLQFFKTPVILSGLPAPVDVKVNPVRKSGSPVAQFKDLFSSDLDKSLVVEWQMPSTPGNSSIPGFMNSLVSFYNSFRFPSFIVERSTSSNGEIVEVDVKTQTVGGPSDKTVERYNLAKPISKIAVRNENGDDFRNFEKKFIVKNSDLLEGIFTSTYRYIDDDPTLEPGKPYYYRVRAYFGDVDKYAATTGADSLKNSNFVSYDTNQPIIRYGTPGSVVMGPCSSITRGFVPRIAPNDSAANFNLYDALYDAVKAAVLLNFELNQISEIYSGANATGTPTRSSSFQQDQMAGWGTLAAAAGQISIMKPYYNSKELTEKLLFKTTCRRISNQSLSNLYTQPSLMDLLFSKWNSGVSDTVSKVMESDITWTFPAVSNGFTKDNAQRIEVYLNKELGYQDSEPKSYDGPFPVIPGEKRVAVTADERRALAEFLRMGLASMSGNTSYLSWYSVTVGDVFPAFVPFVFDFEQWIMALLKALESAVQAIEDIIETLIMKIRQLEQIIQTIISLIDLMNVKVTVSAMIYSTTSGSVESLSQAILESENKPAQSPYGLHSGLIMAFGGPGEGSLAALNAIKFLMGAGT
jgi:hypothetical protein